jgi:hypothetical protein
LLLVFLVFVSRRDRVINIDRFRKHICRWEKFHRLFIRDAIDDIVDIPKSVRHHQPNILSPSSLFAINDFWESNMIILYAVTSFVCHGHVTGHFAMITMQPMGFV